MPKWDPGFHVDLKRRLYCERDVDKAAAIERMIAMQEDARDEELAPLDFGATAWWVQTTAVEELRQRLLQVGGSPAQ